MSYDRDKLDIQMPRGGHQNILVSSFLVLLSLKSKLIHKSMYIKLHNTAGVF